MCMQLVSYIFSLVSSYSALNFFYILGWLDLSVFMFISRDYPNSKVIQRNQFLLVQPRKTTSERFTPQNWSFTSIWEKTISKYWFNHSTPVIYWGNLKSNYPIAHQFHFGWVRVSSFALSVREFSLAVYIDPIYGIPALYP